MDLITLIGKNQLKGDFPDIKPGAVVRVHQKVKEGDKTRTQIFEGVVISRKHGRGIGATVTVRRIVDGIGVERIFPLHAPTVEKISVVRQGKVRRAKLYFLRGRSRKSARMKEVIIETKETTETPKTEKAT